MNYIYAELFDDIIKEQKTPIKIGYMSIYDRILCNNPVPIDGPVIVMDSADYHKYTIGKD